MVVPQVYKKYFTLLNGRVALLGGTDAGKTTFARLLYSSWASQGKNCAFLDLDPGQTKIGVPGYHWLLIRKNSVNSRYCRLLGSISPRGFEDLSLENLKTLISLVEREKVSDVVLDTCGYIRDKGVEYKLEILRAFKPDFVVLFVSESTEKLLQEVLLSEFSDKLLALQVQPFVKKRDTNVRTYYRKKLWKSFLSRSVSVEIHLRAEAISTLKKTTGEIESLSMHAGAFDQNGVHIPCAVMKIEKAGTGTYKILARCEKPPLNPEKLLIAENLPLSLFLSD